MSVPPLPRTPGGSRPFLEAYIQGLSTTELEQLFTRDTPDAYERLREGGLALGMFEQAAYEAGHTTLGTGDVLVMYSDGVTEAEDRAGQPLDEAGLQRVVDAPGWGSAKELGWATFAAVERHTRDRRLLDDVTVLIARKLPPLPVPAASRPVPGRGGRGPAGGGEAVAERAVVGV